MGAYLEGTRVWSTDSVEALRERCRKLNDKLSIDAILRQGSPVDTILAFVQEEINMALGSRYEPMNVIYQDQLMTQSAYEEIREDEKKKEQGG